jgi:lysophospholipase L1-like esterase
VLLGGLGVGALLAWRSRIGLDALLVGYPLALAGLVLVEAATVALVIAWRRRRGRMRTALARLALAGFATLFALMAAEAVVAAYLAWEHRVPELAMVRGTGPKAGAGDDVTLVVVGESSAEGVPYRDWLSVGKVVAWQLRRVFPQTAFHLEVQARAGWTLETMHQKLAESTRRPDAILLYAGHNEFASRDGWSSSPDEPYYHDDPGPPWPLGPARRLARLSPIGRLLREARDRALVAARPRSGSRPLVDVPSCSPAEAAERLADFERRVDAILRDCARAGVVVVVVVPPGNDAGFDPNRSVLPRETPRAARAAFARRVREAVDLEAVDPPRAVELYRRLIAEQPGFALTHYRLACLLAAAGTRDEAYREFVRARDLDGHPMRCPIAFQDVFRRLAARHGAVLVDGQAIFHERQPDGLLDDVLFNDGMHPSLEGTAALASGVLSGLKARRAFGWPDGLRVPTVDAPACAEHFDVTTATWKEVCRFASGFYRATAPIGCDPAGREAKARRYEDALRRLEEGADAGTLGLPGVGIPAAPTTAPR